MAKKFKRALESLDEVFDFINDFITANKIGEAAAFSISLAIEELFTNMVKYNPGNANDIEITIEKNRNELAVTLIDPEVEPFDVTQTAEVDVTQPLADRKTGGLGIHLVKKMVDRLDYEYANRQSKITLVKYLES
ncbi:MAG: ATP-binding protein [candidate division KSB1 bacterium]|nr:ATP-binding protein [candidate division KSB1 bacterium]MDZ7303650.1 ATP-binding protein [candidate division KSB1 bacterium]MDZ7313330.1 ATP-binding protein [candidate division KSB1 bacterium]